MKKHIWIIIVTLTICLFHVTAAKASGSIYCADGEIVVNKGLNLRAKPGMDGKKIIALPKGTKIKVLNCEGVERDGYKWIEIETKDQKGWVAFHKDFVSISLRKENPPSTTPDTTSQMPENNVLPINQNTGTFATLWDMPSDQAWNEIGKNGIHIFESLLFIPIFRAIFSGDPVFFEFDLFWLIFQLLILCIILIRMFKDNREDGRNNFYTRVFFVIYIFAWNWSLNATTECKIDTSKSITGSFAIDMIPVIGEFKNAAEIVTGCDSYTGEKLGSFRWLGLITIPLSITGGGDEFVESGGKVIRYVGDDAAEGIIDLARAGADDIVESSLKSADNMFTRVASRFDNTTNHAIRDVSRSGDFNFKAVGPCSFTKSTLIETNHGLIEIQNIEKGNQVLAFNEKTQKNDYYTVTDVFSHDKILIVTLNIGGEIIETTYDHLFYVEGSEWIQAGTIQAGERIRKSNGKSEIVTSINIKPSFETTYNLTVEEAHTYYVGEGQYLVHNECPYYLLKRNLGVFDLPEIERKSVQSHHIIPVNIYNNHPFFNRVEGVWDNNGSLNGVVLPNFKLDAHFDFYTKYKNLPYHQGSHGWYSKNLDSMLDELEEEALMSEKLGSPWTQDVALEKLQSLVETLRNEIYRMGPIQLR